MHWLLWFSVRSEVSRLKAEGFISVWDSCCGGGLNEGTSGGQSIDCGIIVAWVERFASTWVGVRVWFTGSSCW
jgi:hypothetical protein